MSQPQLNPTDLSQTMVFRVSPLIRFTLFSLYLALMLPLPFLPAATRGGLPLSGLFLAIALGGIALYGALSEQVCLDTTGITLRYPFWVPQWFRRGWSLPWSEIQTLKASTTGQGGLVYYLVTATGQAYLLPMRIVGFAAMVRQVQAQTGIDTSAVKPLAQPWMYAVLLVFTLLMFLADAWILTVGLAA